MLPSTTSQLAARRQQLEASHPQLPKPSKNILLQPLPGFASKNDLFCFKPSKNLQPLKKKLHHMR
jgi:hypothetical protein